MNHHMLLQIGGLLVAASLGFGVPSIGAEEIKVGGGSAPIENVFKKVKEPFEKAAGMQLVLTSEGPDQAFINVG